MPSDPGAESLPGERRLGAWVLALAVMSFPAQAATDIALCPSPGNGGQAYFSADGSAVELVLGAAPAGCPTISLPIGREDILWAGLMPAGISSGAPIALIGSFFPGAVSVSEIESVEDSAQLLPVPVLESNSSTRPTVELLSYGPQVAGWVWRPEAWRDGGDVLIARATTLGMDTLFVTVPVAEDGVEAPAALAGFVASAQTQAIRVWAVDGDPHAVLPSERGRFVRRAGAYAAYNRAAPPEARLAGLQLDIEPYVLPGYAQQPEAFDHAWARTITEISAAAQMPTEAVIPFWFATGTHMHNALDPVADKIAGIAVMAYRGDATGVADAAIPALDWGRQAGVPVRVSIESGPIPNEDRLVFRPTELGTLWQTNIEGFRVMILLARPLSNPLGPTLGLASQSEVPGRRISFLGDARALAEAVDAIRLHLGDHPAYHGIAIHGILD